MTLITEISDNIAPSSASTSSSANTSSSLLVRSISFPFQFISWLVTVALLRLLEKMGNHFAPSKPESPSSVVHPTLVGRLPPPQPITQIEPELFLYTESSYTEYSLLINVSHSPEEAARLIGQHLTSTKSRQDNASNASQQRLVILTHGFLSTKNVSWLHQLKDAILTIDRGGIRWHQQTVLLLGWGGGADIGLTQYPQAAANALEVGRWLGDILAELRQAFSPEVLSTYAVGHSLGAHLLGAAGRRSGGQALDRITGLDPAGVGFQTAENADHRLGPADARLLVDIVHTDGQDVPYFGTLLPMGRLDFYPNYGWNQPTKDGLRDLKPDQSTETVPLADNNNINNGDYSKGKRRRKVPLPSPYGDQISESHSRAIELFTWSVGNGRAFRTNLKLDGTPDVEAPVHRVVATGQNGDAEVSVEMGYYADEYMDGLIAAQASPPGQSCAVSPRQEEANINDNIDSTAPASASDKYKEFAGCYYVHTNATPPWS